MLFIGSIQATIVVLSTNDTYLDRSALFGPGLDQDMYGYLLSPTSSPYGCEPLTESPPTTDWIALVERGKCSFATKVRAMQLSQAKAVIIGDPNFNHWITMYATGDTSDIEIPSFYVAQYQFRALQLHSLHQPTLIQLIQNDQDEWSFTDLMIVIVLSPSMMMMMIYFGLKCRAYQRRQKDVAPRPLVTLLPSRLYRREKQDQDEEECAICLEPYHENDRIRTLPCRHEFHMDCVDTWLTTRKKFCPICKYNICYSNKSNHHADEQTPLLSC
ncbi:hypothetical protein BC941DRAFT_473298 [Chlamydoabsidia padenii]|nr:hypothetical protein BC941DRAFT_473298 [Chlamydoabsidia padenii]